MIKQKINDLREEYKAAKTADAMSQIKYQAEKLQCIYDECKNYKEEEDDICCAKCKAKTPERNIDKSVESIQNRLKELAEGDSARQRSIDALEAKKLEKDIKDAIL